MRCRLGGVTGGGAVVAGKGAWGALHRLMRQIMDKLYVKKDMIQSREEEVEVKVEREEPEQQQEQAVEVKGAQEAAEVEARCGWRLGELAWARVGSHPYWPCLVTRDPYALLYARKKLFGRSTVPSYAIHVTFFADNGRHSWLACSLLMPFTGLDDFNQAKSNITAEMRKRDPKYCASFDVKDNKKPKWLSAVTEAEMLLRRPLDVREELSLFFRSPNGRTCSPTKKIKKEKEVGRKKSIDVSLSESLFDSLFESENGCENHNPDTVICNGWTNGKDIQSSPESAKKKVQRRKRNGLKGQTDLRMWLGKPNASSEVLHVNGTNNIPNGCIIQNGTLTDDEIPVKNDKDSRDSEGRKHNHDDSVENSVSSKSSKNAECSKFDDPRFRSWLDVNEDFHRDSNPNLDGDEFLSYVYQVWEYGGSGVLDEIKNSSSVSQVKGSSIEIAPSPPPSKKPRRSIQSRDVSDVIARDKSYRKGTTRAYVYDDESDSSDKGKNDDVVTVESEVVAVETESSVDVHMESLKVTKPNIFKGYNKEKVCEICEMPSNIVRCQGPCRGMFHVDCCQRQLEIKSPEEKPSDKRRKGRPKTKQCESSGSESGWGDELDNTDIPIANMLKSLLNDVTNFEVEFSKRLAKRMEKSKVPNSDVTLIPNVESTWRNIAPGQCVIVDFKLAEPPKVVTPPPMIECSEDGFRCHHCMYHNTPLCSVCKQIRHEKTGSDFRQRCSVIHCNQFYHSECLEPWPQTKYSAGTLTKHTKTLNTETMFCPKHVCHTCVSDDPQGCKSRFSGDKLAKCMRCPATYHSFTQCVPAGTRIINASHVICPRHCDDKSAKTPYHVNTSWCFICAKGGTLICCETCPTSFHAECLNIPLPEDGYICEDCETGRLPLYEELVWVKLGQYRWWPALVLHPHDIPPNINALPHQPGQFAVRFFGVYDHYWVNKGRVFPYQEGDTGHASSRKSSVDTAFLTAVKQAHQAYEIIKEIKQERTNEAELSSSLLPPKFVKLKVNRAIGNAIIFSKTDRESSKCDCDPKTKNPCAPDTDCLNRMLLTECSPNSCAAGDRCCNQAFEKRLYPPLQPSRTSERGWGLKAMADIKKGDFVIEYVGEVIDETEFQRRMKRRQEMRDENYYFLTLDKDRMIDAGPKGNIARFMNHSCEPNCETQKWTVNGDVRVGLFALKDIIAGSEVTFNYNLVCAGDDKKKCLCGTTRCAGYIGAKPKQEEQPPKKPKKIRLKRKYHRRIQKSNIKNSVKTARRGRYLNNNPDLNDIDRDVELINSSLKDDESMENVELIIYKPDDNLDDTIKSDEGSSRAMHSAKNRRKARKWRGIKRKRPASKFHQRTKIRRLSNSIPVKNDSVKLENDQTPVTSTSDSISNSVLECKKEEIP